MRSFNLLAADVDIKELAAETKNYSGAELEGLVRAAQSTAMNRHIKVGQHLQCFIVTDVEVHRKLNADWRWWFCSLGDVHSGGGHGTGREAAGHQSGLHGLPEQ